MEITLIYLVTLIEKREVLSPMMKNFNNYGNIEKLIISKTTTTIY